jgi:dTDP-4-amino-4,6-dideoxygalactose transaminase
MVRRAPKIATDRAARAAYYDAGLAGIPQITIPARRPHIKNTYLLYMLMVEDRDALLQHCLDAGIEAKIHYPIPLYQQQGLAKYGYKAGDFPVTDRHAGQIISFPVDQHLTASEQDIVIEAVRAFYGVGAG